MHPIALRASFKSAPLLVAGAALAALSLAQLGGRAEASASSRLEAVRLDRHAALAGEGLSLDARLVAERDGSLRWAVYLSTDAQVTRDDQRLGSLHTESVSAGETRALSTLVTLPASLGQGSYTLGVIAELAGDDLLAACATPVSVGDAANLRATLRSARTSVTAGETLEVTLALENGGLRASGRSTCRLYLSRNDAITRYDRELGSFELAGLSAGRGRSETLRAQVPAGFEAGDWYVGVLLDTEGEVAETSEDDNAVRADSLLEVHAPAGIDLAAEALTPATRTVTAGDTLRLTRTIKNLGSAASGTFRYALVLSNNQTISSSDPELSRASVSSLAPGAESTATVSVTIPAGTQPGTYWVGLRVDPDRQVNQTQTNNDALAATDTITVRATSGGGQAELTVSDVTPTYRTIRPGEDLPLRRRIRNTGGADAPAFSYVVVLSRDRTISTADRELYRFRFPQGLAAGDERDTSAGIRIPQDVRPGEYYLGVIVDVDAEVAEADETDGAVAAADFVRVDRGTEVLRFDPARVHVADGDTLHISGRSFRLVGMDTPEKASPNFTSDQEPYASTASRQTRDYLNAARELALHVSATDQYGRTLAQAFVDGRSLAKLMIESENAYETIRVFGDAGFPELADDLIEAQRGHYPQFERPWLWRWSHSTH
ncbi:MAG: CARDB domain-containing protein [Planctomycetota bacterium]